MLYLIFGFLECYEPYDCKRGQSVFVYVNGLVRNRQSPKYTYQVLVRLEPVGI
jgi:hypothetical protein